MERDAKYAAVAAFALLAIAAAVAFVWWYSGSGERRDFVRYEIYFDGSVSGLAKGSPVRYLGVDVGRVRNLAIARDNPSRVRVMAEIDSEAPISGATRARLGLLGLTGLLYIDLQQDPEADPARVLAEGQRYPVIPVAQGRHRGIRRAIAGPARARRTARLSASRSCSPTRICRRCPPRSRTWRPRRATCRSSRGLPRLAAELRRTSAEVSALAQKVRAVADKAATADRGVARGRAGDRGEAEPHGRQSRADRRRATRPASRSSPAAASRTCRHWWSTCAGPATRCARWRAACATVPRAC